MNKQWMLSLAATALFGFASCDSTNNDGDGDGSDTLSSTSTTTEMTNGTGGMSQNYVDLRSGGTVRRDDASGRYVDESGSPVDFYVDMNTRDTFYGLTGQVVNNALIHENDNWRVDDSKIKVDGDEMKIKDGDSKTKIEGDEYKSKSGDTKVKVDGDETKIKSGDTKIKTENGETKIK
ncbi:MAG: hypothetical protein EOP04_30015 [Proteobacteria bacterium]|nr:MAG: hypothetical protein EOP04_30015 [Pseudomonadota bacterium]